MPPPNPYLQMSGMVQMNLTGPHQQNGPAMSSFASLRISGAKHLAAGHDRPFAALRVTHPKLAHNLVWVVGHDKPFAALRVTRWDCSNCLVRCVQLEP